MKSRSLGVIGLVACMLMAACASPTASGPSAGATSSEPASSATTAPEATEAAAVSIRYAHYFTPTSDTGKLHERLLKEFQAANPNITLVEELNANHQDKMKVDLAADNLADVFIWWLGPAQMQPFVDAGAFVPLDDFLAESKVFTKDSWPAASLADATIGGVTYGLPRDAFKCFAVYNTDIFDRYSLQPPKTVSELKQVAKVLTDNGIVPLDVGSKGGNPGHVFFNEFVSQAAGGKADIAALTTSFNVSTAAFKTAAATISDLRSAGVFPQDTVANGDWGPSIQLYNQGKAAMLYTCPWMLQSLDDAVKPVTKFMEVPALDDATLIPGEYFIGSAVDGLFQNSKSWEDPAKRAAIVALVDYMWSDKARAEWMEAGATPAWTVTDTSAINVPPLTRDYIDFTSTAKELSPLVAGQLPNSASLDAFLAAMDDLFAGGDPVTVIDDLQVAVENTK
jgi:ABC-type glycerol-3-phosphate transport system substrate-binding protein